MLGKEIDGNFGTVQPVDNFLSWAFAKKTSCIAGSRCFVCWCCHDHRFQDHHETSRNDRCAFVSWERGSVRDKGNTHLVLKCTTVPIFSLMYTLAFVELNQNLFLKNFKGLILFWNESALVMKYDQRIRWRTSASQGQRKNTGSPAVATENSKNKVSPG